MGGRLKGAARALALAALFVAAGAGFGLAFNALRPHGLPLVAPFPYAQDCPEKLHGPVDGDGPIAVDEALRLAARGAALLVDSRPAEDFARGHLPGARSLPLSVVSPVSPADAAPLSSAALVVVYCDSPEDRMAAIQADQLRQAGIARVRVLAGGAAALRRARGDDGSGGR